VLDEIDSSMTTTIRDSTVHSNTWTVRIINRIDSRHTWGGTKNEMKRKRNTHITQFMKQGTRSWVRKKRHTVPTHYQKDTRKTKRKRENERENRGSFPIYNNTNSLHTVQSIQYIYTNQ